MKFLLDQRQFDNCSSVKVAAPHQGIWSSVLLSLKEWMFVRYFSTGLSLILNTFHYIDKIADLKIESI